MQSPLAPAQYAIADTLSKLDGITIIGGGDSVAAVEAAGALIATTIICFNALLTRYTLPQVSLIR